MTVSALEQIYYLVVIVGTIAVVLLLFYLIERLNQANRVRQDKAAIQLRRQFMDLQIAIARNEDLANLYQRGLRGFTGLSDTEQTRFFIISAYAFTHWSEVQRYAISGLIPERYWQELQHQIQDYVQYPGVQQFWSYRRHWYPVEFRALIDKFIEEAPAQVNSLYPEPSV